MPIAIPNAIRASQVQDLTLRDFQLIKEALDRRAGGDSQSPTITVGMALDNEAFE